MPWAGHMAMYAARDVYRLLQAHKVTLVFVNTRAQAELMFGALWRLNRDNLPIALHHGSLAVEQRRKVEAAMAAGSLRAVVCTSSLDLGIDWGDIELVVQVGAPKGAARLLQRIGRANHRLDEPSRAMLVPANRFEVLECIAAQDALAEHTLDGGALFPGGFDVLAQHVTGTACSGPFDADAALCRGPAGGAVRGAGAGRFRRRARLRRDRRLCARDLRPLPAPGAGRGWAVAADRPEAHAAVPDERRHHRRGAGDAGAARARQGAGGGRGVFRGDAQPRRHVPVRRAAAGVRGHPRQRGDRGAGQDRTRPEGAGLCRRQAAADHASGRPGAPSAGRAVDLASPAAAGGRVAGGAGAALGAARHRTSCWSRPSRGVRGTTSSPTASPAATRTRPWACC